MRTIEWTSRFKKDYRREQNGQHRTELDADLSALVKRWPTIGRCSHGIAITPCPAIGTITAIATSSPTWY